MYFPLTVIFHSHKIQTFKPVYSYFLQEDFSGMLPVDDKHWKAELEFYRTFCIYENGLPNGVLPDIHGLMACSDTVSYMDMPRLDCLTSDFEDYMKTTSDDEDLP